MDEDAAAKAPPAASVTRRMWNLDRCADNEEGEAGEGQEPMHQGRRLAE
jgi:hypothetical protein